MYLNLRETLSLLELWRHWVLWYNKGWSPQDDQRLDGGAEGRSSEQSLLLEGLYCYRASGYFY